MVLSILESTDDGKIFTAPHFAKATRIRKGAEAAKGTLRSVPASGSSRSFFTGNPFHPMAQPSGSIGSPYFVSSHKQGSAFLSDLCGFAVKN
jgi:hypothetical protein